MSRNNIDKIETETNSNRVFDLNNDLKQKEIELLSKGLKYVIKGKLNHLKYLQD